MKVFNNEKFVALCYLVLIKPGCVTGMPILKPIDTLFNILRIFLFVFILISILKKRTFVKNRLLGTMFLLIIATMWEVLSTFLNNATIGELGALFTNMGIIIFTYAALSTNENVYTRATAKVLGGYIIVNLITVLLFPNGMYQSSLYSQNFFLSYRTAWFTVYLLGLTTALLWHENEKTVSSRNWCFMVIVAAYASMIIEWTATGLFCFTVAGLFIVFWRLSKRRKVLGIKTVMLIEAIVFYVVIIERMMDRFAWLIVGILKKDITLTSRTRIWDNAIRIIKEHYVIGVGRISAGEMRNLLGYGASHPHCRYLYLMLCFGVIGLGLFLIAVYYSTKGNVAENKERNNQIVMASLIAMLTACQVESLSATGGYMYPLLLIAAGLHCTAKNERKYIQ